MPAIQISETLSGPAKDITVVRVEGSIDAESSEILASKLDEIRAGTANRIVVDLSRLKFISSSGMRVFLALEEEITERNGGLKFASVPAPILNIFQKVGIGEVFRICPTEKSAIDEFLSGL